jgi:hypothetical protein
MTPEERAHILGQLFHEGTRLREVDRDLAAAVADARALGASWEAIAEAVDLPPDEARRRWARPGEG